jgi:hypothetical protein
MPCATYEYRETHYYDQIWASIKTVFRVPDRVDFSLPLGIAVGHQRRQRCPEPWIQIFKPVPARMAADCHDDRP